MGNLQWDNLEAGVAGNQYGGLPGLARTTYDNKKFQFPGDTRKNLGEGDDYTVQRGFIRSLLTEVPDLGGVIPNRRFFFQFNPERIMRSVSVSSGLMNPLLQDPSQFSMATPGNATFSFDILLNREMEVNNATEFVRNTKPTDPGFNSPGRIGVLADLTVMDSIIGQGISQDTIAALAKLQSLSSSWDTTDTSSGAPVPGTTDTSTATTTTTTTTALDPAATTFTAVGTSVTAASTYTGVYQSATSGSGNGATFTVVKTGSGTTYTGVTTVTVTNGGTGYQVGNTITISGAVLGGATPANDLTLTVGGAITTITGTPPATTTTGVESNFISIDQATNAFTRIIGNSAFLVSTPVRIVFSSLFMVDGFIQGSAVNFTKFSKDMIPTMCAINITVEAKYIGFAKKDTYLTETLKTARNNPNAGAAPEEVSIEGPMSGVLRAAIAEISQYLISVSGVESDNHDTGNWSGTVNHNDLWEILNYEIFLFRAGFTDGEDAHDKGIGKLFYDAQHSLTFTHQPTVKVWRSFAGNEGQEYAVNGVTNTGFSRGDGTEMVDGDNKVKRDVLLLYIQGQTATCTDYNSWKKYKSYGGGGRTEDSIYDNQSNNIFVNGKKDDDLAHNLYLLGDNAKGNHTNDNHLMLEIDLTISATIRGMQTQGMGGVGGSGSSVMTTSSVVFTQKILHSMDSQDFLFKKFQVENTQVK
jgi:hypothetical protein